MEMTATKSIAVMNYMTHFLQKIISGERRGFFPAVLRLKLLVLSWIYLGAVKLRRWLYSRGVLRVRNLPCKVISVGNVAAGGSGKTPAVIAVARMLSEYDDLSIAVLSRGYRSQVRGSAVVSDGEKILLKPAEAGDEPYLLSRNLPGVPVLIGKDRVQTGLMAVRRWDSQVVVLDDGFQYLRLARDADIVVVDATRPFGLDHFLPRGYLREPLSAIKNADLILLTRVDQCENLNSVRSRLTEIAPSVPIFESVYEPSSLYSMDKRQEVALDTVRGKKILAVCGIANPLSFVETLRTLNPAEVDLLSFPDHHAYPPRSIEIIRQRAAKLDAIVTTEKDAQKLTAVVEKPFLSLKIELKLTDSSAGGFSELIRKLCDL